MSISEAFQKRIFEPLKLTHSLFPKNTDSKIPDPHPQGYQFKANAETLDTFAVPSAPAAGRSRRHAEAHQLHGRQPVVLMDGGSCDRHP